MEKEKIVEYLQDELSELQKEYEIAVSNYRTAKHMDRIGMAQYLDKITDKYYHFYMVCNDLGIISAEKASAGTLA